MKNKIIMSSSRKDKHGDIMSKQLLEKAVEDINSKHKLRWTIDHKRELPPLGRIDNAELLDKDDHYFLAAEPVKYSNREEISWDNTLIKESFDEPIYFTEIVNTPADEFEISLDKNNFSSFEIYEKLNKDILALSEEKVELAMHGRKAEIPIPEIVLTISKYGVLYLLLKPFVEKIAEKLAEDTYDETKKRLKQFSNYVAKVVKLTREKALPKKRKLVTIFELHGTPHIELFARTDDPSLISKGLTEKNLCLVRDEVERLSQFVEIGKIQFVLSENGKWKFNYLLTVKGEAIGKKSIFKTRDQLYKKITLGK